ncbi:MAG: DEAD/DEAH box helicase [Candidatus Dormibacteria bacterium]
MTEGPAVVFVPGDPGREGRLVVTPPLGPIPGSQLDLADLVVEHGPTARRELVHAQMLPMAVGIGWLLAGAPGAETVRAARAWEVVLRSGLALVARGRIFPSRSCSCCDTWRVGPLDIEDEEWLRQMSAVFPWDGRGVPAGGSGPSRILPPDVLIREFWDALADTIPRTAAAPLLAGVPAYSGSLPVHLDGWEEWLAVTDQPSREESRPGLRLELPGGPDQLARVTVQLRSHQDPALVIEAADLWRAPRPVLAHFGSMVESDLLLALRRGSAVWGPIARLLESPHPDSVEVLDEEVEELLGKAAAGLTAAGLELLWPQELAGGITAAAAVDQEDFEWGAPGLFDLDSLLRFRWELTLDGQLLTPSEVDELAEAKRPWVRLRDRWVTVDPELIERLRQPPPQLPGGAALAAALGDGTVAIAGEKVPLQASGGLAELVDRLKQLGSCPIGEPPPGLAGQLRPYQHRGLAWLDVMCQLGLGGCLADDMGLGKTIQVIALQLRRARGPALVVCPASLIGNWEREIARFAPDLLVRRYHGGDRHLDDVQANEFVLTTYGVVLRDRESLSEVEWDLLIADEAQHVKNPASKGARELRGIGARARLALTGTPIENRLSDLWAILDWTTPGLLGSLAAFGEKLAAPVERFGDQAARERLTAIVSPFILRRRKSDPDIAPELPPKTETDHMLALSPEQATLYEAVVRETLAQLKELDGIQRRGTVLKLITALKQVCNHPAHYLRQTGPLPGRSGKLAALDELISIIDSEGEATLVFTQYVAMARLLERYLEDIGIKALLLHGGIPPRQRDRMVESFQAGQAPVFLLSLKAGGVGLNLTRASHVIHYDRWWNPAVEDQATDRAYRIGQTQPVQVHRFICQGTLEERIAVLMERKRGLADSIVGAGESWITELSDEELAKLVELRSFR